MAVDWSASSTPKLGRDSIWIGVHGRPPENPPTRAAATARLRELLREEVRAGRRVLVGFDFAFGYPRGFAAAVAPGEGAPWRRVWDALAALVCDDERNRSNRFAVAADLNRRLGAAAFWGAGPDVPPTRPAAPLPQWRRVEAALRLRGAYPKSVWQLSYAGCVGSQTLLGIPRVRALRDDPELAPVSAVWPFEAVDGRQVVHAEIWPSLAPRRVAHPVKDAAQVASAAEELARLDRTGELASLLDRLDDEEGWILGA